MNGRSCGNTKAKPAFPAKASTAIALVLAYLCLQPISTVGAPQDGTIVSGAADIGTPSANNLSIDQHSDKVIIDWRSFSIEANENVAFSQPSADSLAVNRVIGSDPSDIFGTLTANGRVMLINPNGVLFGVDSRVDVHSLLATTIDIDNERIEAGDFTFDILRDPSAIIINRGHITAAEGGLVALVAPGVENTGVIEARLGTVTLGAATAFTIDLYGDGLVQFPVGAEVFQELYGRDGQPLTALVDNSGRITVDGGTVHLTARAAQGVVDKVINMDGIVEARTIAQVNGEIVLLGGDNGIVEVAGTLDASGTDSGQTGGTIKVLGEKIGIVDGAVINTSGNAGGGEILIGGNFQGKGPEQNATVTFVAPEAALFADAIDSGDGGKVIVWSDGATRFYGAISAKGGMSGGNGGFAEVSGKDYLDYQGLADLTAPFGTVGELLLDPNNITINVAGTEANTTGAPNYTTTNDAAILRTGTIETQLATAAVTVTTLSAGTNLEAGNIVVDDTITAPATAFGLTLDALADITINAAIDMSAGTGGLSLLADGNLTVGADLTTGGTAIVLTADDDASGAGTFTLNAGTTVNSGGANITITGDDMALTATGAITGTGAIVTLLPTAAGTIDLGTGGTGALNLTDGEIDLITAGTLRIGNGTAGAITLSSAITPALTNTLRLESVGAITDGAGSIAVQNLRVTGAATTLDNAANDVDVLAISGAGNGTFVDADDITIGTVDGVAGMTGQRATLTATGDITIDDNITGDRGVVITNNGVDATTFVNAAIRLTASSNRTIDITTDDLEINTGTGSFGTNQVSGTHTLNIKTLTAAQQINLGAANTASNGIMELSAAELARLNLGSQNLDVIAIGNAASTGRITISDSLANLTGNNRTIQNNADVVQSAATTIGTLIIDAATGVTLDNVANDVTGTLTTSTNTGNITIVDANDLTVGVTTATAGNVDLSADDGITVSGNLTAGGTLVLEGDADNAADVSDDIAFAAGITATSTGTMTLDATTGAISGAGALTLTSADGVVINDDITTVGALTIEGDSDNAVDTRDDIAFLAGATMTSGGLMTLDATTGGIGGAGALTLNGEGITLNNDVTTAGLTTIDADDNNDGAGTFTLGAGATVNSTANDITITAADMVIDATAAITGTGSVVSLLASNAGTIDLGGIGGAMDLSDAELDTVTAAILRIGDATAGAITVSGAISPANAPILRLDSGSTISQTAGITATSLAIDAGGAVTLTNAANEITNLAMMNTTGSMSYTDATGFTVTTLDSITGVNATAGAVTLTSTGDITIANTAAGNDVFAASNINIFADTGLFTVAAGAHVQMEANAGIVTVEADDMEFIGTLGARDDAGTGFRPLILDNITSDVGFNLGSTDSDPANLVIGLTQAELLNLTARETKVGSSQTGDIVISQAIDLSAAPTTSLELKTTRSTITDTGAGTLKVANLSLELTGTAVSATLDNVANDVDVLAVNGLVTTPVTFVDADGFTVGTAVGNDGIVADSVNLSSVAGDITISNTGAADDISAASTVDITAGGDESALTLAAGADIQATGGATTLTADKMAIAGTITATGQTVTLAPETAIDADVIDLGSLTDVAANTLELSDAELDNITATALQIGTAVSGNVNISAAIAPAGATTVRIDSAGNLTDDVASGIAVANLAASVGGDVIIDAGATDADTIAFTANNITFSDVDGFAIGTVLGLTGLNATGNVSLSSADGLDINSNLTITGDLSIEGDSDNAADTRDDIAIAAGVTLNAGGTVTLDATTGGISGAGALTLSADDGVVINDDITTVGALTIEGDADNAADTRDDIAITAGITLSAGGTITLDATTGKIAGAGALTLTSDDGVVINDNITTVGALTIEGDADNAADTRDDIAFAAGTTATSTGTMTLDATTGKISGAGALTLTSDDGVVINDNITAAAALTIEGDADNAVDTRDDIAFAAGVTATSTGTMTLDATTGGISGAGALTLTSDDGVVVNNNITTVGALSIEGDADNTADTRDDIAFLAGAVMTAGGTITLDATTGKISGAGALTLTSDDGVVINDNITAAAALTIEGDADNAADSRDDIAFAAGVVATSTGTMTLDATTGDISGAGALTLTSDDGIVINDDITTVGALTIEGDADNLADTRDDIAFAAGAVMTSGGLMTLDATTGGIGGAGTLTLNGEGITLNDDLTTAGGTTIDADDNNDGAGIFTLGAGANVNSTANNITITGADMVIDATAAITGTGALVSLLASNGGTIDLGGAGGALDLSDAELDTVTAGTLRIGDATAGAITISGAISPANAAAMRLYSSSTVSQTAAISVGSLSVIGGGAITLNNAANEVTNLALNAAAGNVAYTDATGFTVTSVDGIDGARSTAGSVALTATAGDITLSNTAQADDVFAASTVDIIAGGDESTLTIAAGADIQATGGATTLTADKMAIAGTITATGQTVTLAPETAIDGDAIDIGSTTDLVADTLELSDAELDAITAGDVVIGSGASGAIDLSAAINTLNTASLHLISGAGVTQTGAITEASLAVDAGGAVILNNVANEVTNLAINTTTGNVAYTDATGFAVTTVSGVTGVSTAAGSVSLASVDGNVTIANTAAANDIFATTTIDITAGGDESLLAISTGADVDNTGGATTLRADNMDIAGTVTATGQTVTLTPEFATGIDAIDLGSFSDVVADTLGLSANEINRVTAGAIQIGDANSNSINISAVITPAGTNTMRLDSAGSLTDNGGAGIVVANLAANVGNAVAIDGGGTDADTIALAGNNIIFSDVDGFAIGTVLGLVGLNSAGNVSLSSQDGLDITQNLTVVGNLSIDGDSDNAVDTRDDIAITAGITLSAGGTITLDATTGKIAGAGALTLTSDDGVVINDDITTVGALTIEGDADNAVDTRDDIAFLAGATMTSGGTMTLDATTGGIAGAGALTLTSDDGVVINDDITTVGALTIEGDADNAADTRDDIVFGAGAVMTSTGTMTLDATTGGIAGAGALTLTSDDGVVINDDITTVGALTIEGDADNLADTRDDIAFGAGAVMTSGGTMTLDATTGGIAGAGALTLTSDDGIVVNNDITTVGALAIEGDADNAADTRDDIAFLAGATMTSGGLMTLDATTGGIAGAGALTLDSTAGITLNDDLTTAGATTIDADTDGAGGGDFTIVTTKALNTGGNALSITANDVDISGSLNSGAASTTLLVSDAGTIGLGATAGDFTLSGAELQRITATGLTIGDITNGSITVNGITAANSNNITGTVTLNATLDEADVTFATAASTFNAVSVNADDSIFVNTDITTDVGNLALIADFDNTDDVGPDQIQFGTGTITLATAGALTLQALTGGITAAGTLVFNVDNGFTLGGDLTLAGALTIDADADNDGTGIFTVNTGINLSTTNNLLSIIASDIAINGTGTISSGTAATSIVRSTAGTIGLGATAGDMTISGAELQQITANGLTIGDANTTAITVNGITAVNSNTVGAVTLNATSNTGTITFATAASTFDALTASANDVLAVNVDITADTGNLALDGDADNTDDASADNLTFTAGRTLSAIGTITLDATTGGIAGAGALTLTADDGVAINDNITTVGALTIEGDADNAADTRDDIAFSAGVVATSTGTMTLDATTGGIAGAGALTLTSDDGIVINDDITTVGALSIEGDADNAADTRDDIAFAAGVTATSTGTMTLDATTGGIAGAGALTLTSDDGVVINDALTAAGTLSIDGDADNAVDTRDDIAFLAGASITLANTLTLDATTGGINGAGALSLTSDDGVVINADITAAGALTIEGDANNAADTRDDVAFGAGVVATSTGAIIIDATTGGLSGAGALSLVADNGVTLNDNLTTNGTTSIDADNDNSGAGDFGIIAGKTLSTTGNTLIITANDIDLQGTLNSGGASTTLLASDGGPIDIGQVGAGLNLSGAELTNITATGLTIGDTTSGDITVNGITGVQSNAIAGTVTLNATRDNAQISFVTTPSTFNALTANADDGITVDVDLTTDTGNLTLNGDFDNAADTVDKVSFTGSRTLTSAGGITLQATTGGIAGTGALTLIADNGITLADALGVTGAFSADADANNAADGNDTLSLGADLTSGAAITLDATTGGVALGANIIVTGGGIITLNDPLDGLFDLTVDAGTNDIILNGAIGAVAALDALILDGTALTGDVHSATLQISGDSAVLTGTVNGLTGEAAAADTNLTGTIGAGPYTMNGFDILTATPPPPPPPDPTPEPTPDPTPDPSPDPTPEPTPEPTPPGDVTGSDESTAVVVGFAPLYDEEESFVDDEQFEAVEVAAAVEDEVSPALGETPAAAEEAAPAAVVCTGREGEDTSETECAQIAQ